jgi:hypothetical protein
MRSIHKFQKVDHILGLTNIVFKKDRPCGACQSGKQVGAHHHTKNIMITTRPRHHHTNMDASQGSEVLVVNGFLNVILKELPGMPHDRDIEFVIELKPGTAHIYMTLYRMATLELVELKEHIKKLLEKGFICPSSSL